MKKTKLTYSTYILAAYKPIISPSAKMQKPHINTSPNFWCTFPVAV